MATRTEAELTAALYRVSRTFHAVQSVEALIPLVLEQTIDVLDAEGASLWLVDEGGATLTCRYAVGHNTRIVGHTVSVGSGIVGRVVATKRADVALDVQADPRFAREFDHLTGFTTRSMLSMPLVLRDECLGAIQVVNRRQPDVPFSDADVDLLDALALDAALALSNARLTDHLQQEVERQTRSLRETQALLVQREKMAALGSLAAGMAHELNNPSAAAGRAAEQLRALVGDLVECHLAMTVAPLDGGQLAQVATWVARLEARADLAPCPDAFERLDYADTLAAFLRERGVLDPDRLADDLVEHGLQTEDAAELVAEFGVTAFGSVARFVGKVAAARSVARELEGATERIAGIVDAMKRHIYLDRAPVQEVDVNADLDTTLVILKHKLDRRVAVSREYQHDLPRITAYASELNQVWTNLIDNALDAMAGSGTLTLRTCSDGEQLCVDVEDTGPGVLPASLPRIFDPFFTTKPVGKGTGLGLHLSYQIVQRHSGRIAVESAPGRTVFCVRLPLVPNLRD